MEGFADTVTIAYAPTAIGNFQDFQSYRNSEDVVQEIGDIDMAARENDIWTVELDSPQFPALQSLGEIPNPSNGDLARLQFTTEKLLLILGGDLSHHKTRGTKARDAVVNTLKIMAFAAKPDPGLLSMSDTKVQVHAFRAILFDVKDGILIDTAISDSHQISKGQGSKFSSKKQLSQSNYRSLMKWMNARCLKPSNQP